MVVLDAASPEKKKKTRRGVKKPKAVADDEREESASDWSDDENAPAPGGASSSADVDMAVDHFTTATVAWADVPVDDAPADDDAVMIDTTTADAVLPSTAGLSFPPLPASAQQVARRAETRRIPIPPHRMTPLKKEWINIFTPLTEMAGLQVRMNVMRKAVEIRVRPPPHLLMMRLT